MYGIVAGEEFSPDTFVQRSFYYYEIPLVGLQVSPVYRSERKSDLVVHLRTNNLLPASRQEEPRWHFVHALRGSRSLTGDAHILCTYFDIQQDDHNLWLQWSQDHPELAAILWPAVAEVARGQQYVFVPDLLDLAAAAEHPDAFRQQLGKLLARKYSAVAANHFDLELYDDAVTYYTKALDHNPHDSLALTGRADAYQAAGHLAEAAADRKQAERDADRDEKQGNPKRES